MEKLSQTRAAFLWTNIFRAPFWAIYSLLLFILYKDLHASPLQIALFIALRPVVSLFSMYWGAIINRRPDRLLANVVWAGVIGYVPFLLFPLFYSPWYVLFASAVYMMMHRGVVPAWMEIFKQNLPSGHQEKVFSYGSMISYIVGAVAPLLVGPLLDTYVLCWRWIFLATALLGLGAIVFQLRIPIHLPAKSAPEPASSLSQTLVTPWTSAWSLMKHHLDFRAYQIGFMIFGGCGLMLMQPALPCFFIDVLGLSYTSLSIALSLCKGVGFALTSPLWARRMPRVDLFRFSSVVTLLGALFPILLLLGTGHVLWVYIAYFAYGMMQAGSELSWHLSGPLFAQDEDSSPYSTVNVLTVGLRGCVIPQVGSLFCLFFPSQIILVMGGVLCVGGTLWMLFYRQRALGLEKPPVSQRPGA